MGLFLFSGNMVYKMKTQVQEPEREGPQREPGRAEIKGHHQGHVQAGDGENVILNTGQRLAFEALAFITSHSKPNPQVWLFHSY